MQEKTRLAFFGFVLSRFLRVTDAVKKPGSVHAHCDIPCGIYTTRQASIAAETVEKMAQKIEELKKSVQSEHELTHNMARFTATKEEWAEICKRELFILWADYFKADHLKKYPDLHDVFWQGVKLCSQNKREADLAAAKKLRELVDGRITQIFKEAEESKGEKPRI